MRFDFIWAEHEEYGYDGWAPMFMLAGEAGAANSAVHDIMEHFPSVKLDTDGELMALGAMLYIRGKGGFFHHKMEDILSSDISMLYVESWKWGKVTNPGNTKSLDEETEYWISKGIEHAVAELSDMYEVTLPDEDWKVWVTGWLRKGFRKARRRYGFMGSHYLAAVFARMQADIESVSRAHDYGTILRVNFTVRERMGIDYDICVIDFWDERHPDYIGENDEES